MYSSVICGNANQNATLLSGGGNRMAGIKVGANESIDSALRRFKRETSKAGVLAEIKKRKHYEKPSVKRKKKSEAARRKNKKTRSF